MTELLQGPDPVETVDLHLKLCCKLKIFEPNLKSKENNCSLLTSSQYYGLIFIGNLSGFTVINTKSIKQTANFTTFPRKDVLLSFEPTYLSVDFTQKLLCVVCTSKPGAILYLFNIASLSLENVTPSEVIYLTKITHNPNVEVFDLMWQPNTDGTLMLCLSDGSVLSLNPSKKNSSVHSLPGSTQAMCFCWSPKGKQIVVGCSNGTLSQYKPDLKIVKALPAPTLFNGFPTVVSVLWISNYQFAVAYGDKNNPSVFPVITIVNAVKNEPVRVINYEDITYSSIFFRNHQIYMSHYSAWNLIFISSANSIEVAILHLKDNLTWEQWLLGDASRAELPLNSAKQETFPLGLAFDLTSENNLPWGESLLTPMPRLLLLSNEGVLCIFNVVNLNASAPNLCGPPKEQLADSLFITKATTPVTPTVLTTSNSPLIADKSKEISTSQPLFGQSALEKSKQAFTFSTVTDFGGLQPQNQNAQVTISVPGTGIVGSLKDVPVFFPKQQDHQQQSQPITQPQLQQQQSRSSIKLPQISTTSSQFGVPNTSAFNFGVTPSNLTSNLIPVASQPNVNTAETAASPKLNITEENVKGKCTPNSSNFPGQTNLLQSTPIKTSESEIKSTLNQAPNNEVELKNKENFEKAGTLFENSISIGSEIAAVDDSVYWNALQDEIDHFNSELQHLSSRVGSLDIHVGTSEGKNTLLKSIENLTTFLEELKETTVIQGSEIHSAVTDLIESFAWLEHAKSRNVQRKNPSYIELKRSEELDPISSRHMSEIDHLKYYIENQLKQLISYIEKEWMEHQNTYRIEVKNRMAVPTLEEVYKTMHFQLKILNKQRALVENLKSKMTVKKRFDKTFKTVSNDSTSVLSTSSKRFSELSKLADNLLQLKLSMEGENLSSLENNDILKSQLKIINERSKRLTSEKQAALRDMLSERGTIKLRPIKSTFETSSFLRSLALEKAVSNSKGLDKDFNEEKLCATKLKNFVKMEPKIQTLSKSNSDNKDKISPTVPDAPENMFVSSKEKPSLFPLSGTIPSTGQSLFNSNTIGNLEVKSKVEDKVLNDTGKPDSSLEPSKISMNGNSVTSENQFSKKVEESNSDHIFTFGFTKPSENVFGKSADAIKFSEKPTFDFGILSSTTPEIPKTSTSILPATNTASSATSSTPFVFTLAPAADSYSLGLTKQNISFEGKQEASSTSGNVNNILSENSFNTGNSSLQKLNMLCAGKQTPKNENTNAILSENLSAVSSTQNTTPLSTASIFGSAKNLTSSDEATSYSFAVQSSSNSPLFYIEKKIVTKTKVPSSTGKSETDLEEVDIESTEEQEDSKYNSNLKISSKKTPEATLGGTSETKTTSVVVVAVQPVSAAASTRNAFQSTTNTTSSFSNKQNITTSSEVSVTSSDAFPTTTIVGTTTSVFSFGTATSHVFSQTSGTVISCSSEPTNTTSSVPNTTTTSIFEKTPIISTEVEKPTFSTPTANIFGGSASTSEPIFGQASAQLASTVTNVFGSSTPLISSTNAFERSATPTTSSSFTDTVSQTSNVFGQLLSESNQTENVFASPSTTSASNNIFSTSKNIFSDTKTTTTTFGGANSSIFGQSSSLFGQNTTSSSIFGQAATSNSFLGQNICSPFGGSTAVTANQNTVEGGGFGSKSIFGQSVFGQTTGNTSIFGGSPTSSIFGGSSTSPSSGGSVFQAATTSTYGSTSPGPFSSVQDSVAKTGFGASTTFQNPLGGFGSAPVFGSGPSTTPAFGAAPTFSGSATFASSTFGSRSGLFDSSQGNFSQPQGHSATFESLANQNTMGFGNLAQQSQSQAFGGFATTPTFENKAAFGGSSFSNWRSK